MTPKGDIWSAVLWPRGWSVSHVASTGSTNDDLLKAVEEGVVSDRSVLATDFQTAGRGRLDRVWEAPSGANLLVSILFTPVPDQAAELTHRVGLAAVAAIAKLLPESTVGLKWPNDVLLDGRKLAGILARRSTVADAVVVGLGLNVGWAPAGAASLRDAVHHAANRAVHPAEVLAATLTELDALPGDISTLYREKLVTLGQVVRVELPGHARSVVGKAIDVDGTGRLLVLDDHATTHRFDVGDIVHLRLASETGTD